jgi:DNA repair protein RecO (recombination protein O)
MSYAVHTTPGLIIGSKPYGEAGKVLSIFTRDFGLVAATAQGIRLEKSKLRYHAQDFELGSFSLVRGKEFWRLTSAAAMSEAHEPADVHGRDSDPLSLMRADVELKVRIASLLKRLLHGEEANPSLFACVESCMRFLDGATYESDDALTAERAKTLESLVVLRILHSLGYIGSVPELDGHLEPGELSVGLLDSLAPKREEMNRHINTALRESHL